MLRMLVWVAIAMSVSLTGCATTDRYITPTKDQSLSSPPPGMAQVVFLRPSSYFSSMLTFLHEVQPDGDKLIGPVAGRTKVVHNVEPGERLFQSNNAVMAHFMRANLEAGKRYFVLVRPIHGYGYQLRPLRTDGTTDYNTSLPEFQSWITDSETVKRTPYAEQWVVKHADSYAATREAGWENFQAKNAREKKELTLRQDDGVDP